MDPCGGVPTMPTTARYTPTMARSNTLGPESRPVAIPADVDDPGVAKASGSITLPITVRWSEPAITYDLDDRDDRVRVYEQVLREGDDDDIRRFIVVDDLIDLWDVIVLPPHVREAWRRWIKEHRGTRL